MATLRDHIKLEIAALEAKLTDISTVDLLDTEILELRKRWNLVVGHFWSKSVEDEQEAADEKAKVTPGLGSPQGDGGAG